MALVESPVLDHRDPLLVELGEDVVRGVDGSLEVRGVADVEGIAFLFQFLTAVDGLLNAVLGKLNVGPTGEEVRFVPLALAVSYQYQCVAHYEFSSLKGHITVLTLFLL